MTARCSLRLGASAFLAVAALSARAETIFGITDSAAPALVSFDSATPSGVGTIAPISGLAATASLMGIDFRPSDGRLYALAFIPGVPNGTGEGTAQLYTLGSSTGAASPVGTGFVLSSLTGRMQMDFNPATDRLTVVSNFGTTTLVDGDTGGRISGLGQIGYAMGDVNFGLPTFGGLAYSNNVGGASSSTLFVYDLMRDTIATVSFPGPPSPGPRLHTVGKSGHPTTNGAIGLDISGLTGTMYLTLHGTGTQANSDELYRVNPTTGAATQIGSELGVKLLDISVAPAPVPEPVTLAALGLGAAALLRRRRKS